MTPVPPAPFPRVPSAGHPEGLAAGGAREGCARWGTHLGTRGFIAAEPFPAGGGGGGVGGCSCCCRAWSWGCCGGRLIPCPILECYSVTYNRVTRAAADVPNASIGHRNKEGRAPGSGLYNPERPDALIGSGIPGREGI
jgi:hypothetical protein